MNTVTFVQMRPATDVNEVWAATRRREGTLCVEIDEPRPEDVDGANRGGLVMVSRSVDVDAAAYVVSPQQAHVLAGRGVPGWRITVVADGERAAVLDALARSSAAYVRSARSGVEEAAALAALPGIAASVSVFVDSVRQAIECVERGATDLILRGWDTDSIGDLRSAIGADRLVERTAFPPGVTYDEAATELRGANLSTYLNQIDASGRARPRYGWAPGVDSDVPRPADRLSAAWGDDAWREGTGAAWNEATAPIRGILARALEGAAPTRDELVTLFGARGPDVEAVADAANLLRERVVGDDVTFVVNRNINYTNQCYFKCGFCAFSKGPRSLDLRGEPYLMTIPEVVDRAEEAWARGATEVCLQGGIHPEFTGAFYVELVEAIKRRVPDMHIHGYTPLEVWQGAQTAGVTVRELLVALRDAGLGTLPGTAAEILDDDVRRTLCPDKIRTSQWAEVMITAHELGIRSTATIMFGHVDGPESWANHLDVVRTIQGRTGGFTEFVPLPFVHMGSPIWLRGEARPGPTWDEVVLMHAVARIGLVGSIDNVQASWVKLGLDGLESLLRAGCNDIGGTLMDESISRAAGAAHGTEITSAQMRDLISDLDRRPVRRSTLYEPIEVGLSIDQM